MRKEPQPSQLFMSKVTQPMGSWQIEICNTHTVKYDIKSTVPCSSHGSNFVGGGGSLRSQCETQAGYFRSRSTEQSISLLLLVNQ